MSSRSIQNGLHGRFLLPVMTQQSRLMSIFSNTDDTNLIKPLPNTFSGIGFIFKMNIYITVSKLTLKTFEGNVQSNVQEVAGEYKPANLQNSPIPPKQPSTFSDVPLSLQQSYVVFHKTEVDCFRNTQKQNIVIGPLNSCLSGHTQMLKSQGSVQMPCIIDLKLNN